MSRFFVKTLNHERLPMLLLCYVVLFDYEVGRLGVVASF